MKQIPMLSKDLIEQLTKDEPELDIRPDLSKDVIMYRSGRLSIIKELRYRQEYFKTKNPNRNIVEIKQDVHESS